MVRRYASATHCTNGKLVLSSSSSVGRATLTMLPSMVASSTPIATAAMTNHLRE